MDKLELLAIKSQLDLAAYKRQQTGKANWKPRGFRYVLEDIFHATDPNRVQAHLIPMSVEAAKLVPSGSKWAVCQDAGLTYEHAVPLGVIFERLMEVRDNLNAIQTVLENLFLITWVTKEEDTRLNQLGLNRRMPADWNGDVMARYNAAEIELSVG